MNDWLGDAFRTASQMLKRLPRWAQTVVVKTGPRVELVHYHCPMTVCSSSSVVVDVFESVAKVRCSLGHTYWLSVQELTKVEPYWPFPSKELKK